MEAGTRYADSSGVSIAYQVHGEGPLDLVFVPGFVSHVEDSMDDLEAVLAAAGCERPAIFGISEGGPTL